MTQPTHNHDDLQDQETEAELEEELEEELEAELEEEFELVREELDHFRGRVFWLLEQIPAGQVCTYGTLASWAGHPRAARAVGNLLKHSLPDPEMPWHRVINARGAISSKGNHARASLQRQRLREEGVEVKSDFTFRLPSYRWEPRCAFWLENPSHKPTRSS